MVVGGDVLFGQLLAPVNNELVKRSVAIQQQGRGGAGVCTRPAEKAGEVLPRKIERSQI